MSKEYPPQQLHAPVLLDAVLNALSPRAGHRYLDLTAGYGGHASAVIDRIGDASLATLVDRDARSIAHLQTYKKAGATLLHLDFATAATQLIADKQVFDCVLLDVGVSSPQLDMAERGFSFSKSAPLDMRMDESQQLSADHIINRWPQLDIERILVDYGEIPLSAARRIAFAIKIARPIHTTEQLATVITKNHRGGWSKIHPATRTFQALRIAVNNELDQLNQVLPLLPRLLRADGRVAVISFHSLEDRLVKHFFADVTHDGYDAEMKLLYKKPIRGATDDVHNPRARSATLRAAVKIKI